MQVLPANPLAAHLGSPTPPVGAKLPPNPLTAHLAGTAAPVALQDDHAPVVPSVKPGIDPTIQNQPANVTPAPGQRSDQAKAQRAAITQTPHGGATGMLGEWVGPNMAHLLTTGHVGSGGATGLGVDALGLLPFGKLAKGVKLGVDAVRAGRTAEEAGAHVAEAAATAKAEGFGNHIGGKSNPPLVEKGVSTPETAGGLGQTVRESLPHAPAVRGVQKGDMSAERAQRVQEAQLASEKAGGGTPGHLAAKAVLKGAYGRGEFQHLQHLSADDLHALNQHVDKAPLQFFEKTTAKDALSNAIDRGVAPTEGEQALLERVFGKVASTGDATKAASSSFWDKFVSYTNIPRAVRSSADVSAALRQGLVVLVTHPRVWGNAFAKSLKSFGSEQYYQAAQTAIHNDPLFPLFEKWKVPFTDIGGKVANTEEAFIGGQAAEHLHELPGIKGTPLAPLLRPASNVIRRSDRAFTGFQNEARFEMAKMLAEKASLLGHDLNDEHLGTSIGKVVGTFTGRGVTPKILEGHLTTLNALMFSPRLMAARLNLLSPVYYAKLDPFARAEAMKGARNLVASIGTVMFIAKTLGAEVNFDPRSSNFTKIKIGNTRIDIAGGFSQYVRFVAQEMTREAISSSGHKSHIGWGKTDISDLSNLGKLARSKAAPIPSLAWDETSGKDFIGQPIKQGHEAWSNAPFVAQDTRDAFKQSGSKSAIVDAFLSAIGLGVQSYKDKPPGSTGNQTTGGGEGYWGGGATSGGQGYWGP